MTEQYRPRGLKIKWKNPSDKNFLWSLSIKTQIKWNLYIQLALAKIKSLSAQLNHARRLMGWKTVLLWNGIMCICDADLKGKHLLRIKIDERKNQGTCAQGDVWGEPIGKVKKMCIFTWLFSRFVLTKTRKFQNIQRKQIYFQEKMKNEMIFFPNRQEIFIKFSRLSIYPRCPLTAIIKTIWWIPFSIILIA